MLLEKKNGYGIITLNRPEKRNAMSRAAQAQLWAALEDAKPDCRVIIVTGAGDVAFCSGVDLSENRDMRGADTPTRQYANGSNSWFETQEIIKEHPAVFIAAVNGYALGGGLTLVHNCELAIASETAQFGMPEVGFGVFPGLAGPATIQRILPKHYSYMILTARRIDAHTAERWGIVNEVVAPAELLPRAEALAQHITQFDPVVLDFSKKAIREIPNLDWSRGIEYGVWTGTMIRSQTTAGAHGVDRFLSGKPNPGQGTKPA
ncbi:MAG TPA: enoyl-CoA hydratase/isomerase family protein [Chloroflexota bacterium]